jgi:hypothetical protein
VSIPRTACDFGVGDHGLSSDGPASNVSVHWEPLRVQVSESGEMGYTSGSYMLSYTGRFLGTIAGTVPIPEFFSPENLWRATSTTEADE